MNRSLVIFMSLLTFLGTSTGWGMANSAITPSAGQGVHAQLHIVHSCGQYERCMGEIVQEPACLDASGSACETNHHRGDMANSCCGALECHAAVPASAFTMTAMNLAQGIEPSPLEIDIKEASATRLDRPPRSVDRLIVG